MNKINNKNITFVYHYKNIYNKKDEYIVFNHTQTNAPGPGFSKGG